MPFPPDRGDKIRSYHLLKKLAQMAPIHVATFADDDRDIGFAPDLAALTVTQAVVRRDISRAVAGLRGLISGRPLSVALFDHPDLHAYIARVMKERPIAAVFVFSGQMAQYVPDLPAGVRFIMDFGDMDSEKFAEYGRGQSGPMGWVNRREGRVLFGFEQVVGQRADVSTFVSDAEAAMFRKATGLEQAKVRAVQNGVDLSYFHPLADFPKLGEHERGNGPLCVFTGQMDYRPNIEAVSSFARHALPILRQRYPDARFAIVGRAPTKAVKALAALPGVIVTGGVPDVRGWVAAADVVIAPLRIARGIQNKVLEAMAMARPVVASAQAAEGIDATPGEHFLVAEDAAHEAALIGDLLADPARAHAMGQAARQRMVERYSWEAALSGLPALVWGTEPSPTMLHDVAKVA